VVKSNHETREALRVWLATDQVPRPRDRSQAGELVAEALAQGVLGLLRAAVGDDPAWPEACRMRLADLHRALLAQGLAQLELAARATRCLEAAGVHALPLKGAALAERLYASVADRPMGDVDLLVLGGWSKAVNALERAGLRREEQADHAWVFHDPESGGRLELHHGLSSCPGLFPVDAAGLWERRSVGAGPIAWIPSGEDLLIQLALHAAFQHALVLTLIQYEDLRRLLAQDLDPALALERARRARAAPAVALVLAASQRLWAAAPPTALASAFAPDLPVGLARWLEGLPPSALLTPAPAATLRVRWALAAGQRARFAALTLSPASPAGRESVLRRVARAAARGPGLVQRWAPLSLRMSSGGTRLDV
jgi:hypothetical protein